MILGARRPKGTGSVRETDQGRFELRWKDEHGKRRSKTLPAGTTKRDALRFLRKQVDRVDDIKRGLAKVGPKDRSLAELCDEWMATRGGAKRSASSDLSIIRAHLKPALGEKLLRKIGPREIERFKAERHGSISENTINHHLTLLGTMLRYAKEIGWLEAVPPIHQYKLTEQPFRFLESTDQIAALLDAAREDPAPDLFELYCTAVYTGMRLGELAGLRRPSINIKARRITVRYSYDEPTKSGKIRHIPILDPLRPVLAALLERTNRERVFVNSVGNPLNRDSRAFDEQFDRVLERADLGAHDDDGKFVPLITFHDLRHTFASHWVMGDGRTGGSLFKLQKILGHSSIETTQRYAHLAPDAFDADLDLIPDVT